MPYYLKCPECGLEFEADPTKLATLDYYERCPTCGTVFYAKTNKVWKEEYV